MRLDTWRGGGAHQTRATTGPGSPADDITTAIAAALVVSGEYATWIDLDPRQRFVDFNWAAHQAGRQLGIRVRVDLQLSNPSPDGRVGVLVTAQPPLA